MTGRSGASVLLVSYQLFPSECNRSPSLIGLSAGSSQTGDLREQASATQKQNPAASARRFVRYAITSLSILGEGKAVSEPFGELLTSHAWEQATEKLERLIRVGRDHHNPYIHEMAAFIERHRSGLVTFFHCLEQEPLLPLQKRPTGETNAGLDRAMIPKRPLEQSISFAVCVAIFMAWIM
jgi:hypothetical protein